jgi:hypothetical protein
MRYRRAVEKLRILADACQRTTRWPLDEPFLREVYVFGDLLDGADPIDWIEIALVLNLPAEEVPWESHPDGADWLVASSGSTRMTTPSGGGRGRIRCGTTTFADRFGSGRSTGRTRGGGSARAPTSSTL